MSDVILSHMETIIDLSGKARVILPSDRCEQTPEHWHRTCTGWAEKFSQRYNKHLNTIVRQHPSNPRVYECWLVNLDE